MRIANGVRILLALLAPALTGGDLEGVVRGPGGKPVAGAVVAATPESPNALSDGEHAARVTRSDARGRFRLLGLPGGHYGVTATARDLGSGFLGKQMVPGTGVLAGLTFRLGGDGVSTAGRLQGLPGGGSGRLRVYALRTSEEAGDIFYGEVQGDRYRLSLSPGSYTLRAEAPGWVAMAVGLRVPGGNRRVDLRFFPVKGSHPALAEELEAMAREDQAVRDATLAHPQDPGAAQAMRAVDARNEARLKAILAEHGWPTAPRVGPQGAFAAWLLVQHASADLLKACIPPMKAAAERGELSWSTVALSIDRDLMHDGKPQRYGSQFRTNDQGELVAWPIEDEAHLDERRAQVGLEPFASYREGILRMYAAKPADK